MNNQNLKSRLFLPNIHEYLDSINNRKSVSAKELEEFVEQVQLKTGLDNETSALIVKSFFQEIRNSMLRGETVTLRGLGKFFVASPMNITKKRIFLTFKPYKKLISRLNDHQS